MRVITGIRKGTKLISNSDAVPLSDRAKSGLFSIINEKIEGSTVLDLFAGSGALGIECLSRGAKHATFVDISKSAIDSINENIKKTKFEEKSEVIHMNAYKYVDQYNETFDIVFVFQPYTDTKVHIIKEAKDLLNKYGILVFEHHKEKEVKELDGLKRVDKRNYGIVTIEIYQKL